MFYKFILAEMLFRGRMAASARTAHPLVHQHCLLVPFSTIAQNFHVNPPMKVTQFPLPFQSKKNLHKGKLYTTVCIITQQVPVTKGLFESFAGAEYTALMEHT